ncbi:Bax inhibitor-1 family protein [Neisseriaceae bacterium ESL0693]|nr:Bax inhibitor-1 family protein [Neisseriaceae bacterium ESL0693]
MQQRDTYDYTQLGQAQDSRKNTVLRKTYALMGAAFIPCALGAYIGMNIGIIRLFTSWTGPIGFLLVWYALYFAVQKNRYSPVGVVFMLLITFVMGLMLTPVLMLALHSTVGAHIVELAAIMTAAVFFTMAMLGKRVNFNTNALGRFLFVGAIVLMVGIVANIFLRIPVLYLTMSAGFVIFSSLMIMWQIRTVIEGGEDSYISAALTLFVSIYNIFVSLVQILLALADNR